MKIIAKNLTLGYEGKTVVSDLNFSITGDDFLCIVGENGSGKSTLVKAILGLNKPIFGELSVGNSTKKNPIIGYLSQQSHIGEEFPASVGEVVLSGCLRRNGRKPFFTRETKKYCDEIMSLLEVKDLKRQLFGKLSGGQKQRVLLARAICAAEDGLILDEPVSGLDPVVSEEMYAAVEKLAKRGLTVIMVSHDVVKALKYADKVLYIGKDDVFFGTPQEYGDRMKEKSDKERGINANDGFDGREEEKKNV